MLTVRDLNLPGRLDGVSARLREGEVTAIVGPNGAGKSSLLAALAGLEGVGAVQMDGKPLAGIDARERACAIGYLPQAGEVAWNVSVETLARLGRLPHRTGSAVDAAAVAGALAALGLEDLRNRPVGQLSGGERARALLARVLAGTPCWVLADEPLASLDLAHQQALLRHFRALADEGRGVALVLHDLAQAMNHADRVIVLSGGRVEAEGTPAAVLDEALIGRVWGLSARWLGEPGARALAC